ncbi:membrane-bound ClpP family serine protease [Bacillus pakistanensis]|uniref:Membrane-bound ClpP family serine protease n=1 Tax=Rossellomorea pakistanensis TaxID=992288 RepID=A0ABS2NJF5_9BACI|nr:RND transporter [Bacillus pakistanensis]MBM7587998.1 membrane-bound ClpP family serine protease [Bacillus pakistanensis]
MGESNNPKALNWTVFTILVLFGLIGLSEMSGLDQVEQSTLTFRWNTINTFLLCVFVPFFLLLMLGWKRMFPYNVPLALILLGVLYALIFLTFTRGWVGLVGLMGFFIALVAAIGLVIFHTIYFFVKGRKTTSL